MLEVNLGSIRDLLAPRTSSWKYTASRCLTRISMYRYGDALGGKDEASKLWMVDLGGNELILNTRATGQTLDEGALEVLDAFLSEEKISEEYVGQIQILLCNDCQKRGTASFPWHYHKCSHCSSYNTRLV